jgi:hypothetical protein
MSAGEGLLTVMANSSESTYTNIVLTGPLVLEHDAALHRADL